MSCAFNPGIQPAMTTPSAPAIDANANANAAPAANAAAPTSADPAQAPMVQVLQLLFSLVQLLSAGNTGAGVGGNGESATATDNCTSGGCPAGGPQNPQAMTDLGNIMTALAADLDQAAGRR